MCSGVFLMNYVSMNVIVIIVVVDRYMMCSELVNVCRYVLCMVFGNWCMVVGLSVGGSLVLVGSVCFICVCSLCENSVLNVVMLSELLIEWNSVVFDVVIFMCWNLIVFCMVSVSMGIIILSLILSSVMYVYIVCSGVLSVSVDSSVIVMLLISVLVIGNIWYELSCEISCLLMIDVMSILFIIGSNCMLVCDGVEFFMICR